MAITGIHEHGFIRVKGHENLPREAYTQLTQGLMHRVSFLPSEISNKIEVLESIVRVPAKPLEDALQKINIYTYTKYGVLGCGGGYKYYSLFGQAMSLFRDHLEREKAFIGVTIGAETDLLGETRPGAPVQLNFEMLEKTGGKLRKLGQIIRIDLEGMITE